MRELVREFWQVGFDTLHSWVGHITTKPRSDKKRPFIEKYEGASLVTPVPKPPLTRKAIVSAANARIRQFKERFTIYKKKTDTKGALNTRVEREFKKTINFTLIEIQELMNQLRNLPESNRAQALQQLKDDLDECCSILDSCLNSLEAGHNLGNHHKEENILVMEYRLHQKGRQQSRVETRFLVGLPVERDFRSKPRTCVPEA